MCKCRRLPWTGLLLAICVFNFLKVSAAEPAAPAQVKPASEELLATEKLAAKQKATTANTQKIPVVIERDGTTIELDFDPDPLGVVPSVEFDDPTFH